MMGGGVVLNGNRHLAGDDRRLGRDWDSRPEFCGFVPCTLGSAGQ